MEHGQAASRTLSRIRERRPLVHNITNFVAMDISANVLLAMGASPAMIHAVEEAAEFALHADALVVNIGTLSEPWVGGMRAAIDQAVHRGMPVVLDPVGAGATAYRNQVANRLAAFATVIRGNASEILALVGEGGRGQGVDATHDIQSALPAARSVARRFKAVVAVTGPVDFVTDGDRTLEIRGGHPLLTRITGAGCALSALVAAALAVEPNPLSAATHACALYGVAAARAAQTAQGPGSFRLALLDALYNLDPADAAGDMDIRVVAP